MKGSGGKGRRSLEGKGPTPKAQDRVYHKAYRAKQQRQGRRSQSDPQRREDRVLGRNAVLEALRAGVPAQTLWVGSQVERDARLREIVLLAAESGLSVLEVSRAELDRLSGLAAHQGVVLQVSEYAYWDAVELGEGAYEDFKRGYMRHAPVLVALDGVNDPHNLGAIIRNVSAFGGQGVLVPQRRSAGMTAAAWKASVGTAARVPVARVTNLHRGLKSLQAVGYTVVGLDGAADTSLPELTGALDPLVLVVGGEGSGLSRLIHDTCDLTVKIPMDPLAESLNAATATGVVLYSVYARRIAEFSR